jgi:uncharacterized sporulation protein YeaH/YhbH (DUF444 family)
MPKRIKEDHKKFRDVISGRTRRELKRLIKSGSIVRQRPKGGKMTISIPEIEIPHFVFGDTKNGVGRGPGEEGDVVGRDPQQGQGQGGAGSDPGEGINIQVDLEDVLRFMEEELKLPRMRPKPNQTFEEVKIKYNDISKTGPESLRHTRRTMLEALKRLAMTGQLDQLHYVPSSKLPIKLITPINSDRRYRQFTEIKIPASNAVIFFARDCSGSMDDYRCDIVSDMAWWIDCWIRKFYKRVDRCYFVHDTRAMEVNEEQFYTYRYGGGTMCSSAFRAIADQLENRYPPEAFNIYIFYFSDGDNWGDDNGKMVKIIKEELGPEIVNMIGISQICSWRYEDSVKQYIDSCLSDGTLSSEYIRTAYVGPEEKEDDGNYGFGRWGYAPDLTEEDRNEQIIDAIRKLLSVEAERQKGAALREG